MTDSEYKTNSKRLEGLLELLTKNGKLAQQQQLELTEISNLIATYEEEHFTFEARNLTERIKLKLYQIKVKLNT